VLAEGRIHAVIRNASGEIISNRQQAEEVDLPAVRIMPQVAPLLREETILSDDYIKATMSSRLAPLHFRNQLRVKYDLFPDFKRAVEQTWPGVQIREFIGRNRLPGEELHLEIRNEDFVAEAAEMGHGLQMWLQTMWFITLAGQTPTVILDEPDVYMHADLQRRIIRFLRNRHEQTIITTHSVEIMSEVQPDEILIVDKRKPESCFANFVPSVQAAIERFGSVHNLHLTRLLGANRMILVEGKDLKLIKEFQDTMFPQTSVPFQSLPNMSIGGWGGWKLAVGTSMGFHNALGQNIRTYCLLDSDYHDEAEIYARYQEAEHRNVQLHVWRRKEIENYLLVPSAIARFIASRVPKRVTPPTPEEIALRIASFADELEDQILDAIATEFWANNRSSGQSGANRAARTRIREVREECGSIAPLASGKQLLGLISDWSNTEFGVPMSAANIARGMTSSEIDPEVGSVVRSIEQGNPFRARPTTPCTPTK
jgi:energy-coupling factor transporter ATP-binding protein EcfA2